MVKELNDKRMIAQAEKMSQVEVEPLYWIVEDAITDGRLDRATASYETFLYLGAYRKDMLQKGLKPAQLRRLQEIAYELHGNTKATIRDSEIEIRPGIAPKKIPFEKERELQNYLSGNPHVLSEALEDRITIKGIEVLTDFDYRCDITAQSETKFYPIELKIGMGNHQVVSQINKYCHYFYRKLRYGYYKELQGVVICNGLDQWSINEIRKDGHWCFTIVPKDDNQISLLRVQ